MNPPYDKIIRITWLVPIVGSVLLVLAAVLWKFGIVWEMESLVLSFLSAFMLLAFICLPVFYYLKKKTGTGLHDIMAEGNYWVHWTYDPVTWEKYSQAEWVLAKKNALTLPLGIVVVVVIVEFISGIGMAGVLDVWWIPVGIGALAGSGTYLSGLASFKKNLRDISEAYVGPSGILFRGGFMTWKMLGGRLGTVKVEKGDPSVLEVDMIFPGRGSRTVEVRMPIPPGEEQRAEEVVAKLNALK
ncbi:MAG TPA: hypothetical protein VMM57_10880 [Bacteroidota bacterium]|nr:hypothetical protein [Bacteroidota bacterium]